MSKTPDPLPESTEELHKIINQQAAEIEQLKTKVNWFMEQFQLAKHRQFGKSSEQSTTMEQLSLFNEAEIIADNEPASPEEEEKITYTRAKGKPHRKEILQDLPVEEVEHRLPEEELICDRCNGVKHIMSTEVRQELVLFPAKAKVVKHIKYVYGCRGCEKNGTEVPVVTAPAPNPVISKSYASPSSLAYVMMMKYADGMPLYRLEKHFEQMDISISRSVLSNWMLKGAEWLNHLFSLMKVELLARDVLAADETTVQVLKGPGRSAESTSYMWLYRTGGDGDPPIVLFDYQMTRSSDHPRDFLKGFRGYLQVDGYAGYESVPDAVLVGCWAHARRKFDEAVKALPPHLQNKPSKAREGIDIINRLFDIERKLKKFTAEERKDQRNLLSRPVLESFEAWLNSLADSVLPKCALGTAINYCRKQWPKLIRFLEDGRLEIDNNRAERSIKPFAMGRKAWLFANTPRGASASAIIYSIVETPKENGLNLIDYLTYLFNQLPNVDVKDPAVLRQLLPWNVALPRKPSK